MSVNFTNLLDDIKRNILSEVPRELATVFPSVSKAFFELSNSNYYWDYISCKNGIKNLTLETIDDSKNAKCSYIMRCREVYKMIILLCHASWNIERYDPLDIFNPVNTDAIKLNTHKPCRDSASLKNQLFMIDACQQFSIMGLDHLFGYHSVKRESQLD